MHKINMDQSMKEEILRNIRTGTRPARHRRGWSRMKLTVTFVSACVAAALLMPAAGMLPHAFVSYDSSKNMTAGAVNDSAEKSEELAPQDSFDTTVQSEELKEEGGMDMGETGTGDTQKSNVDEPLEPGQEVKRIYRADAEIETKDFEKTNSLITSLAAENGGFIQDQSFNTPTEGSDSADFTVRIPADHFDSFLDGLSETGNVIYLNRQAQNITRRYYQTSGRIDSLKKERDRLNELMSQAESVSDLIAIEEQLTNIEQELEWASDDLSGMDLDLEYSTVYIMVNEVLAYSSNNPDSWNNISSALHDTWIYFSNALGNVLIFLIYLLPWIVVLGLIVLLAWWLIRRRNKKLDDVFDSVHHSDDDHQA